METVETRQPGDGRKSRAGPRRRAPTTVGRGGDGSVNEVLNGIMTAGLADLGEVTCRGTDRDRQ
jgi:diacylglycerol kinase family enzyme